MAPRGVGWPGMFLWGTSTSAYQIEGGGTNTDWWRYERAEGTHAVEACGQACDSWHRYEEDLDLVASMGLNAYRFSIEWARVEPEEGAFDEEALEHYRAVLAACRARALLPVVTLHHFTLPLWVADAGGFEHPRIAEWMARYAAVLAEHLGELVGAACTINEPNIVAVMGYLMGLFPPQASDWDRFVAVNATLRDCHVAMREALRDGPGGYPIGLALSMQEYEALPGGEALMSTIRAEMEDRYLEAAAGDDFVGVQCYTKLQIGPDGLNEQPGGELTQMGYLFWPESVEHTVRRASSRSGLPVVVTENGIGTEDEGQRVRYLARALEGLSRVVKDGIDVRGYFQWSLLDNFEWTLGYRPKFGLVAVDRATFQRTPKASAAWYAAAVASFPNAPTPVA
jgi:beta-glucosidase